MLRCGLSVTLSDSLQEMVGEERGKRGTGSREEEKIGGATGKRVGATGEMESTGPRYSLCHVQLYLLNQSPDSLRDQVLPVWLMFSTFRKTLNLI